MGKRRENIRKEKKGTIRGKLIKKSIAVMGGCLVFVGFVSAFLNYKVTVDSLEKTMVEAVKLAAHTITHELEGYEKVANELTYNQVFLSEGTSKEQLESECNAIAERNGLTVVGITDENGRCLITDSDLSDRNYFLEVKQNKTTFVSDLVIRKDNGEMNIFIAAPSWKKGLFRGLFILG